MRTLLAWSLALASGCLSAAHRIPDAELARLAQLPAAARGARVHVVQSWATQDTPPAAAPVEANTQVVIIAPVDIHLGGYHGGAQRPPDRSPGGHPGGGPSHPRPPSKGDSDGADAKAAAIAVLALAATGLVIVAATEGARYDGHVQLHPMHPVHLYGPGGVHSVVPLAAIDPATAAWAERALVVPGEGPWLELGRRPLDRRGWTYAMLAGAATSVSADGRRAGGFGSHVQLGYFPEQAFGVSLDLSFGWRDNAVRQTLIDTRYGVELAYYPLAAGKLSAGVFGGGGLASRLEDGVPGGDATDTALWGGVQLQLELTTRLALTGRFGLTRAHGDETHEGMLGLSVY